jgi:hypothetical protein
MSTTIVSQIDPGQLVTFIQQRLPGFADGQYKLTISQHLEDHTGKPIPGAPSKSSDGGERKPPPPLKQTYTFAVLGDRFGLANPSSIVCTFPDNAASGEFDTVLPHVVFATPTLPWARSPMDGDHVLPPIGQDADGDVPTWLAILVLDADDLAAFPGFSITAADATIGDLLPASLNSSSSLGAKLSYFAGAKDLSVLDPGDTLTTPIRVLDLPLPLFHDLAPTLDDLSLLAHVRQVSLVSKPTMPGISDIGEPAGEFAVVIGNRLPARDKTTIAHLVSLEGLAGLLPTDPPAAPQPDDAHKVVRLAVLRSWAFTSTGSTAAFTDALLGLNGRDPHSHDDAPVTALRLPQTSTEPVVNAALQLGYVPLDHNLRDGGKTVSWYRGPLVPEAVPPGRLTLPVASADQALIFDPSTGLFDTSYAAAWTLGRLMALQDKAFSTALYAWKRGLQRQVVDAAEEAVLAALYAGAQRVAAPAALAVTPRPALTQAESAPLAEALHRDLLLRLQPETVR